jgi:hypothetical protein
MRGIPLQALEGERFAMLGGEILDGGDILRRTRVPLLSRLQLWANLEAGKMSRRAAGSISRGWVSSCALGVSDMVSLLRLEIARRLTLERSPIQIYLRLNRPL